jgi:succinate dehydrogenase/fumarate reductase flavoprotein subunit
MALPDFDVIVVGSGAAGLTAAISAHEQRASVIVVEAETVVGGASRLSAGMIMAADTVVQTAAGLVDDKDSLYLEYMLANQWLLKPPIVRRLADESGPLIEWLTDHGVDFFSDLMQGGGERVPRTHVPNGGDVHPGGQYLIDTLQRACRARGIDIVLGNRVDHLLRRNLAVVGVSAGGEELTANAVVLATGGFGANKELISKHLPSVAKYGDRVGYIGPESSRGDAIALAGQVGANLVGHDVCKPTLAPPNDGTTTIDAFIPGWLLLLGPDGRRIADETSPYGQTYGIARAAGDVTYGVFDAAILADNDTSALPTFKSEFPPGSPLPPHIWATDSIQRMIEAGGVVTAQTISELAEKLSLPAEAMIGAVERYNSSAAAGEDRDFGKAARFLRPIATPPFYGVPLVPAIIGSTAFGVEIDATAMVMTPTSRGIAGLYAAGECTGGVMGTRYVGSGNSLASATVFGRVAGRSAGQYAVRNREASTGS